MCITIALDENLGRRDRMAAWAALATLLLFNVFKVPFNFRGFGLDAQFLLLVLVLGYLRPRLHQQADQRVGTIGAV